MRYNTYEAGPALTQEEEETLAPLARAGNKAAETRMLSSIVALVQRMAGATGRRGAALDDAMQAGMVDAWRALRRFDPSRGKWATWAARHARFAILHSVMDEPAGLPMPDVAAPPNGMEEDEETSNRQQADAAIRAGLKIVLGAEDAEVVACEVLEGLSETQCARLLRRSWRTVRASQQRGMARLREVVRARA